MSTYTSLTYHIIFSTKYRKPTIHEPLAEELYAYIGGIIRGRKDICLRLAESKIMSTYWQASARRSQSQTCCSGLKAVRPSGSTTNERRRGDSNGNLAMELLRLANRKYRPYDDTSKHSGNITGELHSKMSFSLCCSVITSLTIHSTFSKWNMSVERDTDVVRLGLVDGDVFSFPRLKPGAIRLYPFGTCVRTTVRF